MKETIINKNYFIKKCDSLQQARDEFERTLAVYKKAAKLKPSRLRIAKPIELKGDTVYFEKITDCFSLRNLICKYRIDSEILYYTGQALAQLHLVLNGQINSLDKDIQLHGDFSASNILYMPATGLIYIIDFAPYRFDKSDSYHYGPAYRDLAHIVLTLEIKYPIYRIYLTSRKKNREMSNKLWEGYEDTIGIKIDRRLLYEHIIEQIISARNLFRKQHRFSGIIWTVVFDKVKQEYVNLKGLLQ